MSPNVPDLKILNLAFSHRLESSYQFATVAPFFNIKVTRYRTCISDRDGWPLKASYEFLIFE